MIKAYHQTAGKKQTRASCFNYFKHDLSDMKNGPKIMLSAGKITDKLGESVEM